MLPLALLLAAARPETAPQTAPTDRHGGAATQALPADVRAVIEAAIASGDPAAVETVARFAIEAHPAAAGEIRRLSEGFSERHASRQEEQAAEHRERLAQAGPLEQWSGNLELGASRSTGTASSFGLFGTVSATRTGIEWTHRLNGRAEIQETDGRRTIERFAAEWQPRLALDDQFYGFGIAQYERDPFVGYRARYSAGLGAGYLLADADDLRVELEGGAVWRRTRFQDRAGRDNLAGRASLDLAWKLTEALELKQTGSLFLEQGSSNARATTALDAALFGPLKLRMSYEVRFDRDVTRGLDTSGTTSRATVLYAF